MNVLEREIFDRFHQLDKAGQRRVRLFIEREMDLNVTAEGASVDALGWPIGFFEETYGSLADDPLDENDNSHLPPPVRDEVE